MARLLRLLPILIPLVRRLARDPRVRAKAAQARDRLLASRRRRG
jgi:hypothetical protein